MNDVFLSIGSNSTDCDVQMRKCIDWISSILNNCRVSHIYETPAINGKGGSYLNAVVHGQTSNDYETLKRIMKEYETINGRTSESKKKGSIPIDIDVVVWNNEILRQSDFCHSYFQIGWLNLNKTK